MMEKGSDRRQARVSRLNRVLALHFKLVQEGKNKVSIEIRDAQCRWLTPGSFRDEQDQHAQGVAVAHDG